MVDSTATGTAVTLRVSFDVAQISSALVWHAVEGDPARNAFKAQGRFAGALHFDQGDDFSVELVAFGDIADLAGIELIDASIITMPHTSVDRQSAPSPFASDRAVVHLGDWSKPLLQAQPDPLRVSYLCRTEVPLKVAQETGRWELSLVVTVRVIRPDGAGSELRVFAFDPESEVGTGGDPPR